MLWFQTLRQCAQGQLGKSVISTVTRKGVGFVGGIVGRWFPIITMGAAVMTQGYRHRVFQKFSSMSWEQKAAVGVVAVSILPTVAGITMAVSHLPPVLVTGLLTLGGWVAGSTTALEWAGHEVHARSIHLEKRAQSLGIQYVLDSVGNCVPVSEELAMVARVAGTALKMVAGILGYHAREVKALAVSYYAPQPEIPNLYDPGKFIVEVLRLSYGDTASFVRDLLRAHVPSSVPSLLLHPAQKFGTYLIEERVLTNVFIRAFNGYMQLLQKDTIDSLSNGCYYSDNPDMRHHQQTLLRQAIRREIVNQWGFTQSEQLLTQSLRNRFVASHIREWAGMLARLIVEQETVALGVSLSDPEGLQAVLEVHLLSMGYLALILFYREPKHPSKELAETEVHDLYLNLNRAIRRQYQDNTMIQWVGKKLENSLTSLIDATKTFPQSMAKKLSARPRVFHEKPVTQRRTVVLVAAILRIKMLISKIRNCFR